MIAGLLVLGTVAAGGPGIVDARADVGHPGGDDAAAQAAAEPTPIASCTTITEPGEYVLTQDLAANGSADTCLRIDVIGTVVIDGQGHSVDGGIDGETEESAGVTLRLELSNATVDSIRYPPGDATGGGGASGLLENVTVETIELWNADGFTIESSRVENDITGYYAGDVNLRNSTFDGRLAFHENTVDFEIVNNTFAEEVIFYESLLNSYIADNTIQSSLSFFDAGGPSENVLIENNHITVGADEANDLEAGGIMFVAGERNVIQNNTIVVERTEGSTVTEANGIFLAGERNLVRGNDISGADHGIYVYRSVDGRIVKNTIHDNDVGLLFERSSDRVTDNTITDNRVGVQVVSRDKPTHVAFERNVLANNTEFGVENAATVEFNFDARNNYWGSSDGPSSAPADDPDAPFADPVTGRLAEGASDAVSEGETPGVSNVRFDPFLTASPNGTDDGAVFYQVDFVIGSDVIESFGPADSDQFYSDQGRLIRFLHGSSSTPVERVGSVTTTDENASCIVVESFEVSDDIATVRYTVPDGCRVDGGVHLVSYEKPGPGWSRADASEQRLVDSHGGSAFNPGTFELTVLLPTNTTAPTDTEEQPAI